MGGRADPTKTSLAKPTDVMDRQIIGHDDRPERWAGIRQRLETRHAGIRVEALAEENECRLWPRDSWEIGQIVEGRPGQSEPRA